MTRTAIDLIESQRAKARAKGYTQFHDDSTHRLGELVEAAVCYATVGGAQVRGSTAEEWPVELFNGHQDSIIEWPFEASEYRVEQTAIENLVKAAALLADEIDRLQRAPKGWRIA